MGAGCCSSAARCRRRSSNAPSAYGSWRNTAVQGRRCRRPRVSPLRWTARRSWPTTCGRSSGSCCAKAPPEQGCLLAAYRRGLLRDRWCVAVEIARDGVGHDIARLRQDHIRLLGAADVVHRLPRRQAIGAAARILLRQARQVLRRALLLALLQVERQRLFVACAVERGQAGEQPLIITI